MSLVETLQRRLDNYKASDRSRRGLAALSVSFVRDAYILDLEISSAEACGIDKEYEKAIFFPTDGNMDSEYADLEVVFHPNKQMVGNRVRIKWERLLVYSPYEWHSRLGEGEQLDLEEVYFLPLRSAAGAYSITSPKQDFLGTAPSDEIGPFIRPRAHVFRLNTSRLNGSSAYHREEGRAEFEVQANFFVPVHSRFNKYMGDTVYTGNLVLRKTLLPQLEKNVIYNGTVLYLSNGKIQVQVADLVQEVEEEDVKQLD